LLFRLTSTCSNPDDDSQATDDSKNLQYKSTLNFLFPIAFVSYSPNDINSETATQSCSTSFSSINKDAEVNNNKKNSFPSQ